METQLLKNLLIRKINKLTTDLLCKVDRTNNINNLKDLNKIMDEMTQGNTK